MKRKIYVQSDPTLIGANDINHMLDEGTYDGFILVEKDNKIVGTVQSSFGGIWSIETFSDLSQFDTLNYLIESFKDYTFVFIQEDEV